MTVQQHQKMMNKIKWLDKFVYDVLSDPNFRVNVSSIEQPLLLFQVVKLHTSYGAVIDLVKKGWGIDSMIIVRSMLNNLINARWINHQDPTARAEKFVKYNDVLRKKVLDVARNYPEHRSVFSSFIAQANEIEREFEVVRGSYSNINEWSGLNIRERAAEANLAWDYDFVYKLASSLEHSDITSSRDFIESIDEQSRRLEFRGGPSQSYVAEAAITAVKYMGEGLELAIDTFNLEENYKKRLHRFGTRFSNLMSSFREG